MTNQAKLMVGNWKMNGTRESSQKLLGDILAGLSSDCGAEVGVCPPAIFIPEIAAQLAGKSVKLGAQNVADQFNALAVRLLRT